MRCSVKNSKGATGNSRTQKTKAGARGSGKKSKGGTGNSRTEKTIVGARGSGKNSKDGNSRSDRRGKRGKENAAFSGKSSERLREEGGGGGVRKLQEVLNPLLIFKFTFLGN